jgi:hypothetical protein
VRAYADSSFILRLVDAAITRAIGRSATHGERLGARAIDLLHVAAALTLRSKLFLTTDVRQAQLARAEGLKVVSVIKAGGIG